MKIDFAAINAAAISSLESMLYEWLLTNYAKPGQRILDTHLGSGSIAIACHYFGAHLTATEIDPDYFAAACQRIERETRQLGLL